MASTYSTSLRLELMATGDQSGTWGDTTNTNLGTLLEQAITGVLSVAQGDATLTLTALDGATDQSRNAVINLTGAMTGAQNVVVPNANKLYLIKNSTSGGFAVTVKTSAGTGVTVPAGTARWVYADGTNVVDGISGPLSPSANDAQALGFSGTAWADLFLASGGVINWNAGDVTVTHSANTLAFAGASSGYTFDALISGTTASFTTSIGVTSASAGSLMNLESTDAGATAGPAITLYRNSASPAASDILGQVLFNGEDSAGNTQEYASIEAVITDPTSTSEDSTLNFYTQVAGVRTLALSLPQSTTSAIPVGTIVDYGGTSAPSLWLLCYGQNVSRTTYAALFAALCAQSTVTISIASPGVVTWNAHGRKVGDPISFTTTGALPTGLTAGTTYFIQSVPNANTFTLSATFGGSVINTSGSQSGVHTALYAPFGRGDGSSTFGLPDARGRVSAGRDDMGGTSANRLTNPTGSTIGGIDGDYMGNTGGAETHTITVAQLASHTHSVSQALNSGYGDGTGNLAVPSSGNTGSAGSNTPHNNVQPTFIVNKMIYAGV